MYIADLCVAGINPARLVDSLCSDSSYTGSQVTFSLPRDDCTPYPVSDSWLGNLSM